MGKWTVLTAISLTVVNGFVTVYCDWSLWRAWTGEVWSRGRLPIMAATAASSIANLWVHSITRFEVNSGTQSASRGLEPFDVPAEARGGRHV